MFLVAVYLLYGYNYTSIALILLYFAIKIEIVCSNIINMYVIKMKHSEKRSTFIYYEDS